MTTEKSSPRPAGRKRNPWARRPLLRRLMLALIPLSILGVIGLLVLTVISWRVARRFEERERESPTRIYGRAFTLREGVQLPTADLTARLRRLGYRQSRGNPTAPGEYRGEDPVSIVLRSFEGSEGSEPARAVRVHLDNGRISWVEDPESGEPVPQARLEPEILTTLYGENQEDRTVLPLNEFPKGLVDAVLVSEDRHFYRHPGIDPTGLIRAALANARSGAIRQGGSTLTQQLSKNLFFEQNRTWSRKAAEAVVAMILEARYSKDRILQAYLNEVYLGQRGSVSIRGFAQAAGFYFGKDVRFLSLSESATLAGLIRAPGNYNPFAHLDRATERRDTVLAAMAEEGMITAEERAEAAKAPLKVRKDTQARAPARAVSYLGDYVRQMIGDDAADLSRAGMRVFTTVDPVLQQKAGEALGRGLSHLESTYRRLRRADPSKRLQGAIVVLDPRDGSVLAMVGGRDYATSQFNRITQARRQPGSLFKPFVYLTGLDDGARGDWGDEVFTLATPLADEPLEMQVGGKLWAPANYDNEFRGPVTAQRALEESLNVPTVRAARAIGLKKIVASAARAGIATKLQPYPSLALGAQEVLPLEMAAAYAMLANAGTRVTPFLVSRIEGGDGEATFTSGPKTEEAFDPRPVYLVTAALQGAMDRGTAASSRALGFHGTAAGKTGTTDDYRDARFAGYTPDLLALVWVGFDDGISTGLTGAQAALPIWVDFMRSASLETDEPFKEPSGIVWEQVDPDSGGLARWSCPDGRWMAFAQGTEPTEKCALHGWFTGWRARRELSGHVE